MRISAVNCVNYKKPDSAKTQKIRHKRQGFSNISFGGFNIFSKNVKFNQFKERNFASDFMLEDGKVTAKECENVIKNHPATLTKAYKIQ